MLQELHANNYFVGSRPLTPQISRLMRRFPEDRFYFDLFAPASRAFFNIEIWGGGIGKCRRWELLAIFLLPTFGRAPFSLTFGLHGLDSKSA